MLILGLDLATSTGFAWGDGGQMPVVSTHRMPATGRDVGAFLVDFWTWLDPLLEKLERMAGGPEGVLVVFEAPIMPRGKVEDDGSISAATSVHTTRKLQGLAGLVEMACKFRGIKCTETAIQTAKKELAGHGHASKAQMMDAARRAGVQLTEGDEAEDEADAFAVWLVGVRYHAPQYLLSWQRRISGTFL